MPRDEDKPSEASADNAVQDSRQDWPKDNRRAIDHYNRRVEEHGVFSDGLRSF
ncbi:type II toxin-antitoxin system CcdA family antitoxin [Pseudomonas sp. KNUC1026]|uniref:type II toxin-antitoxin system CcdA family antitoxin n=1 Tax=Pseudomonas sp. KNUC1026 TaxID=2893890 RepID=UPI001F3531A8|nr:type II toxin-antitoxin system CcdA family antitoxin [Pseudomonas sp. KNUC1026]UFH49588.1 type II toxin-antitoxin system CcdA family antitoxin [Pseudomonas sp. KNUC1026]